MQVNITYAVTRTLDLPKEYEPLFEAAKKADEVLKSFPSPYSIEIYKLAKEFEADLKMLFPEGRILCANVKDGDRIVTLYET